MDVRKKKIGDDYNLVQKQIREDVEDIIAQKGQGSFSERKGVFVGRSITWNAGSDWWDQIRSYFRSFSSDYANAVREEFFNKLNEQVPLATRSIELGARIKQLENVVQNILIIPEEDLPKDKKYVLIAKAYEAVFPPNKNIETQVSGADKEAHNFVSQKYQESITFLKKNALQAINQMARASITRTNISQKLEGLKQEYHNNETEYAKAVIKRLEEACGNNVKKLTALAQNVKMLFEIPAVKSQCGDGKDLIGALLAEIKAPIEQSQNYWTKDEPNFQKAVQAKFKNIETSFLETGENIDRFEFYLAKNAIETAAKLCKNEEDFGLLDFINRNYEIQFGFSQEDQDLLQEIADKHRRYYLDEKYGGDKSEIQLRYLQKVFEEEINNSIDKEATKNKLLSEFNELLANPEIKLSESQKTTLKSTLTKKIQQK